MRINLLFPVFVMLFILTFLFVGDRAEAIDIKSITQGIVKEVKNNFIKIQENIDINKSGVLIRIDPNTVYDNVQKWTDLKTGDKVQIEYHRNDNNKNTAIRITKVEIESFPP